MQSGEEASDEPLTALGPPPACPVDPSHSQAPLPLALAPWDTVQDWGPPAPTLPTPSWLQKLHRTDIIGKSVSKFLKTIFFLNLVPFLGEKIL